MSKLHTDVRTLDLPASRGTPVLPTPDAHLSLADRASLRLGLWLLLRSTRHAHRRADHSQHHRLVAAERHRSDRDQAALRLLQLAPRR